MPFTISHAVLAPPITKLSRNLLPLGAVAIGTMTPDLFRLFSANDYAITHEWRGIIVPDLLLGLFFCLLWYGLFRPVVLRCIGMVKPLNLYHFNQFISFTLRVLIALVIGIVTHLIWDGLTHSDYRTFAFEDFLNQKIIVLDHQYPMHRILQIGTSIISLPLFIWMILKHVKHYKQADPVSPKIKRFAWWLLTLSMLSGFITYLYFNETVGFEIWQTDLYHYIGLSINRFFKAWLITFSLGCLIFLLLDRLQYFKK